MRRNVTKSISVSIPMPEPLLLTVPQVMELIQMKHTKVCELIARGEIPSIQIGRSRRVRRVDLEKWLEDKAAEAAEAMPSWPSWPDNRR